MEDDFCLTTVDNPFNPFTQFDEWNRFDQDYGYYTCAYLARVVNTTDELGDKVEGELILAGMQDIVRLFPETYKIVRPNDYLK